MRLAYFDTHKYEHGVDSGNDARVGSILEYLRAREFEIIGDKLTIRFIGISKLWKEGSFKCTADCRWVMSLYQYQHIGPYLNPP